MQKGVQAIKHSLLNDEHFIKDLYNKVRDSQQLTFQRQGLQMLIEEISGLLEVLIHKKMEKQMSALIEHNEQVFKELRSMLLPHSNSMGGHRVMDDQNDITFNDDMGHIIEDRKIIEEKLNFNFIDADLEKSISTIQKDEDVLIKLHKKVKNIEEKYESSFKSVWNVVSMTQDAVFEHLKQHKTTTKKKPPPSENLLSWFWK